jgi:hypothetical protein
VLMVFSVSRDVFRCNKNPLARQRELFALHASEPLPVSFGDAAQVGRPCRSIC